MKSIIQKSNDATVPQPPEIARQPIVNKAVIGRTPMTVQVGQGAPLRGAFYCQWAGGLAICGVPFFGSFFRHTKNEHRQGISDIHYSVRTIETIPANTRMGFTTEYRHNNQLTADFQTAANQARFGHNQGATTVHIRFKADEKIQLHWYYQPQPNTIAPMRFISEGGLQAKPIIGMINEEVAQ